MRPFVTVLIAALVAIALTHPVDAAGVLLLPIRKIIATFDRNQSGSATRFGRTPANHAGVGGALS